MLLFDIFGSGDYDHQESTNESSDSMTSEFEEGIDHLVRLTKDVSFQVEDNNAKFDPNF